jgi:hypothetical protein
VFDYIPSPAISCSSYKAEYQRKFLHYSRILPVHPTIKLNNAGFETLRTLCRFERPTFLLEYLKLKELRSFKKSGNPNPGTPRHMPGDLNLSALTNQNLNISVQYTDLTVNVKVSDKSTRSVFV